MRRKDIENELGSVKDFDTQFHLKISILSWRKIVVKNNNVRCMELNKLL